MKRRKLLRVAVVSTITAIILAMVALCSLTLEKTAYRTQGYALTEAMKRQIEK